MAEEKEIQDLEEEKQLNALINKANFASFEEQIATVPANYFDQFPTTVLGKIQKRKTSPIISLGRLSIAAAVLFIVAGSYFFITKDNINNTSIAIHEIPTAELDSYVSNNEWMADAEMETEINKLGLNLDEETLSKDSID
jgi:hypothetical protein